MDKYRKQNFKEALPELHKILKGYDPTYNTIRKVKQSMGLIKDASIISIIQEDIPETSDLQYTQIQLIHKKDPIRTKNK